MVIKHNSTYQTVYAHMSKFANGIRSGKRVRQGQTIGYVFNGKSMDLIYIMKLYSMEKE